MFCLECGTPLEEKTDKVNSPDYGVNKPQKKGLWWKISLPILVLVLAGAGIWYAIASKNKEDVPSVPEIPTVQTFTANDVSFAMIYVEGGTFRMGSTDEDANDGEQPVHQVTLFSYSIGETEVTQELWQAVMGDNPSKIKGAKNPVEQVSWNDCMKFIEKLNNITGQKFRLPTEAEWEFAARGGNKSKGYKYSGSNNIYDVAWFKDNSDNKSHPVAQKKANELGIYDMSGNLMEWCQDGPREYTSDAQTDPRGPVSDKYRINRGGSWFDKSSCYFSCSCRCNDKPTESGDDIGLRLALTSAEVPQSNTK